VVSNLSVLHWNIGTSAEKRRAVQRDCKLNACHCGPVTSFLIHVGVKDVKFRGFRELVEKIEIDYDMEFNYQYPRTKSEVKVLRANCATATYDEHIDGMYLNSTLEMLREFGCSDDEVMAEIYDRHHFAWCSPDHRLRLDLLLSLTDWWNGQGGRTLQQYNLAWRFENLHNPPVAPLAPPAVPLLPPPAGVAIAPAAIVQAPVVPLAPVVPTALPPAGFIVGPFLSSYC